MNRIVCWIVLAVVLPGGVLAREFAEVSLDYVAERAEQRARKPFHSPRLDLPDFLSKLDYDKYREIEFRHEKALWTQDNLPFRVEFFHPGYLYQEPVHINEFTINAVQPVRFVQDFFNYRSLTIDKRIPADTGYAGFKVLYSLNEPGKMDELGAFLGASYYRVLGKGQRYGQSARGLALDCGEPDRPEEFPLFTDWWLGKPDRDDDRLKLFAILDSVSCVGAYKFVIIPGETTKVDVDAVLFFRERPQVLTVDTNRKEIKTIGLAPLTSMFWFGKASERRFDDFRSEVHDSDGLLMQMGNDEMLWRPLANPKEMQHQRFAAKDIAGFGLLQRERDFGAYQDLFNQYQMVPSVWIKPHGNWGPGEINLVELSTGYEGLDNVVAFWDPKDKPPPMKPYRFGYSMMWTRETEHEQPISANRVISTRIGVDSRNAALRQFAIDFAGPKFDTIPENAPPKSIASCSENAVIAFNQVYRNPYTHSWRVILKMEPKADNKDPVDIRCTLQKGEEVLGETWTYHWSPP
jgi:glucans biosynthesis protein